MVLFLKISFFKKINDFFFWQKTDQTNQAFHKTLKGGKELSFGSSILQKSVGTTVIVKEFYFNLPIRKKMMVSIFKKTNDHSQKKKNSKQNKHITKSNSAMEFEKIKRSIEELVLIQPHISFALFDSSRETKVISTQIVVFYFCYLFI